MDVLERIDQKVKENSTVIFMKGTPNMPMCGFSSRTAEALKQTGLEFSYVNVIADQEIFQNLPQYADWPTFPQVYIGGELIGGCDITLDLAEQGKLKQMMEVAAKSE